MVIYIIPIIFCREYLWQGDRSIGFFDQGMKENQEVLWLGKLLTWSHEIWSEFE